MSDDNNENSDLAPEEDEDLVDLEDLVDSDDDDDECAEDRELATAAAITSERSGITTTAIAAMKVFGHPVFRSCKGSKTQSLIRPEGSKEESSSKRKQ